jgi:hypothetical protein
MTSRLTLFALVLTAAVVPATASAGIFGTNPVNISVSPSGDAPDGPSGNPSISGDDRKGSLTAFDSDATNLVQGDGNGQKDIFLWHRPGDAPGTQGNVGDGSLENLTSSANGASSNPSVDGDLHHAPHCVAFQSTATNLAPGDTTPDSDIYVRNVGSNRVTLVSDGAPGDATNPSIAGNCSRVAFESGGGIYIGKANGGTAKKTGAGSDPDIAIDNSAVVWSQSGAVKISRKGGKATTVGRGIKPRVSGQDPNGWLVAYQGGGGLQKAVIKKKGGAKRDSFGGSLVAGVTAFAATRGIVTYADGSALNYLNLHSGNSDDLAHAEGGITEADSSARGNFDAFTATGGQDFVGPTGQPSIWFKSLPQ